MEQFRELMLLLESYHANDQIALGDNDNLQSPSSSASGAQHRVSILTHDGGTPNLCSQEKEYLETYWKILPFLDITQDEAQDHGRVAYLCWQRLAVLKTLASIGAIKALPEIALQLLQTAMEYDFFAVVIETAAHLRQFSALHDGQKKKFDFYNELMREYQAKLKAEQSSEDEYQLFLLQQLQGADTEKLVNLAQEACARLQKSIPLQPSANFFLNYYFLKLYPPFLTAQWEEVVAISAQAGALLGQKKHFSLAKLSAFYLTKALGLANLTRLPDALEALSEAIAIEPEHSSNWYRLMETKLIWLIHSRQFAAALELANSLNGEQYTWDLASKRLFNTVLLFIGQNNLLNIPGRIKGRLALHQYAYNSQLILNAKELSLDIRATLSILALQEWLKTKNMAKLISWFENYLIQSQASEVHAQRLISLIDCLRNINSGMDKSSEIGICIDRLKRISLDYTSPESMIEIIPIDFVLELLEGKKK
jgi:hypothetical protein